MDKQAASSAPVVAPAAVGAAGLASALASVIASSVGVTGTIVGAAVTAMLVTAASAIFRSYMEGAGGRLRTGAQRLRSGMKLPGRPDLANNPVGRLRAAFGWFAHLPLSSRRSILIKGVIAAAVAFVLAMGVVWAGERVIGNSLSCGLWAKCPEGREPGIHLGGGGNGAGSSLTFARGGSPSSRDATQDGVSGGSNATQDDAGGIRNPFSRDGGQQPSGGTPSGGQQNSGGGVTPAPSEDPAEQPVEEVPAEEVPAEEVPAPVDPAAEDPAAQPVEPAPVTPTE